MFIIIIIIVIIIIIIIYIEKIAQLNKTSEVWLVFRVLMLTLPTVRSMTC